MPDVMSSDMSYYAKELEKLGMKKEQAELLTRLFTENQRSQAASKKDLKIVERSLQKEIKQVERSLQKEIESVRKDIYVVQNKLIFWIAGFFIAQTALLFTLTKLFA